MTERCLDHLIDLMPTVRREAQNEWAKSFAGSIMRQAKRPSWRPSPKQEAIMHRLADDLFTEADAGDVELIEEG